MLTGKRFRLERATLALDIEQGKRKAITIPAGSMIRVVSGPTSAQDRIVDVDWEGRTLEMFEVDVSVRGTEIEDRGAGA